MIQRSGMCYHHFNVKKIYPVIVLALPLPMFQHSGQEGENEGVFNYPSPQQPDKHQQANIQSSNVIIQQPQEHPNPHKQPNIQSPNFAPPNKIPWRYIISAVIGVGSMYIGAMLYEKYKTTEYLTDEEKKMLELVAKQRNTAEILVLGKAGVGKSYLVNALIGSDADIEANGLNALETKSFDVNIEIQGYIIATLKIWDSVGFYGDLSESQCIQQLQNAKNSGIILLVIDGNSPRLYDDIERLYPILNELYNDKSWIKKTIIVATRGNQVIDNYSKEYLNERIKIWNDLISKKLINIGLSKTEANSMPIIWSFEKDNKHWKQQLITKIIERSTEVQKMTHEMIDIAQKKTKDFKLESKTALIFT